MAKLPPEKLKELLDLYGATRNCAPDEVHMRRHRYHSAIMEAVEAVAIFDVTSPELDSVVRTTWHQANKSKPTALPKNA